MNRKRNIFRNFYENWKKIIETWLELNWVYPHCFSRKILVFDICEIGSDKKKVIQERLYTGRFYECKKCKEKFKEFSLPRRPWYEVPVAFVEEYKNILLTLRKRTEKGFDKSDYKILDLVRYEGFEITAEREYQLDDKYIWLYAIVYPNIDNFDDMKDHIEKLKTSYSIAEYVSIINRDGKKCIKYPEKIRNSKVEDSIINKLVEEYGNKRTRDTDINDVGEIIESEEWIQAKTERAREMIASFKILNIICLEVY
ncbi:MAG: hypothetical protein EU529_11490 [Promethearchaeota archaeon]|nr:MAG: hypothetical protein EU529_11490 [Candidatus Lokiarchaeota archaeon]